MNSLIQNRIATLAPSDDGSASLAVRRRTKRFKQSSAVTYAEYRHTVRNRSYSFVRLFYWSNGKRRTEDRATLADAKSRAEQIDRDIANGRIAALHFSEAQRNSQMRCEELAAPTGKPPELCVAAYADLCARAAAAGSTIDELFGLGLQNLPFRCAPKPVPELVPNFLAQKEADGISKHHLRNLEQILNRFAVHFGPPVNQIQSGAINEYLRNLKTVGRASSRADKPLGPDARYHHRAAINQFFTWCKASNYLPKNWSEMDHVPVPDRKVVDFEILTNDQAARLLDVAGDKLEPFIALQLFAGIRHEEIQKLDWSDISLKRATVYIRKGIAKTGRDRLIPILPNLRTFLEPHARARGLVCTLANTSNALWRAKKRAGIPNGRDQTANVLRKTFISNRLAIVQNIAQVALEAGNSPQKIKDNYNRVPDPEDAKAFFSLLRRQKQQEFRF